MVKGKVFTDGDVLARAKNFQEEKTLNHRLKHLQLQQESAQEHIAKERKTLLEFRRATRQTSGRSPVVGDTHGRFTSKHTQPLIQSCHFRKPWAFSFTETSYNAVYNDDFDPYLCLRSGLQAPRPRVKRDGCKSAPVGQRQKSRSGVAPRSVTAMYQRDVRPESALNQSVPRAGTESVPNHVSKSPFVNIDDKANSAIQSQYPYGNRLNIPKSRSKSGEVMDWPSAASSVVYARAWGEHGLNEESNHERDTAVDLKIHDDRKCSTESTGELSTSEDETTDNVNEEDEKRESSDFIFYKGQKIRHYVRPQDRYKRDPFKDVRREKLLRKLSLENPLFLNGTRDLDLNISSTFSRAARQTVLHRMVEQNRIQVVESRKPVIDNTDLQKRVETFCQSSKMYFKE